MTSNSNGESHLAIDCHKLDFSWNQDSELVLEGVDLNLGKGSRCLLIGANGAGKSTLLRILAGKRLTKTRACKILGQDVFMNPPNGVVYLGTEWSTNPVVRSDIVVSEFLDSVGGYRHKERRDRLLSILDVDLDWHMHQISDGERRRVQLCMGLMTEWDVLLLDEVTVDLDVLVRSDLINFLIQETETRGATIVYATHIFDGLSSFPTHICHLQLGRTPRPLHVWEATSGVEDLFKLALQWTREDRDLRRIKEKETGRVRGPKKADEVSVLQRFAAASFDSSPTSSYVRWHRCLLSSKRRKTPKCSSKSTTTRTDGEYSIVSFSDVVD
ncbi:P-loop containing nucleoside triphosphate hydrolase protein [Kockovaella imperatae]|uniref:p-loop containing nucleoside triphosphate hydrolase protein n=1 Tax=Kockovaella imperatae TaxID=4999 RepID=A0A1Y1UM74_9TREE|nr:P-loop containing nucleoside triphosphate hydrolase protein [Kockovaella imperatae]ORX38627.1 P-loop containing nucleoside triphosphate hydrolase protein [Kockovaella imperatae]